MLALSQHNVLAPAKRANPKVTITIKVMIKVIFTYKVLK